MKKSTTQHVRFARVAHCRILPPKAMKREPAHIRTARLLSRLTKADLQNVAQVIGISHEKKSTKESLAAELSRNERIAIALTLVPPKSLLVYLKTLKSKKSAISIKVKTKLTN
jgi:hypothetical protein